MSPARGTGTTPRGTGTTPRPTGTTPRRGPGRRPGGPDTRGEILAAARAEFAERGYDGATVRAIAARAGVDAALVHHYFGAKEQVFVAAMQIRTDPAQLAARVLDGPRPELGARAVRAFLDVWGHPDRRAPFQVMLGSALTHEAAATMLREFVSRAIVARVAGGLDLPDATLRVELVAAHLVGLAVLRYVVRVEPLASVTDDDLVALVAPVVQHYLDPCTGLGA